MHVRPDQGAPPLLLDLMRKWQQSARNLLLMQGPIITEGCPCFTPSTCVSPLDAPTRQMRDARATLPK